MFHDTIPAKNYLSKAYKLAWNHYLWPFESIKRTVVAIAIQQGIHIGLGLALYPSVEDRLVELGIDREIAQQMSPWMPSFVSPTPQDKTIIDNLYSMTTSPFVVGALAGLYNDLDYSFGQSGSLIACDISMPPTDSFDTNNIISSVITASPSSLQVLPLTDKEIETWILLHEAGHCKLGGTITGTLENLTLFVLDKIGLTDEDMKSRLEKRNLHKEERADLNAVTASQYIYDENKAKQFDDFSLYLRAVTLQYILTSTLDSDHDLALYHDARRQNIRKPTHEEVMKSRKEISDYVRAEFENEFGRAPRGNFQWRDIIPSLKKPAGYPDDRYAVFFIETLEKFLDEKANTASHYAKRRAELFIEGMTYFAPSVVKKAHFCHADCPLPAGP